MGADELAFGVGLELSLEPMAGLTDGTAHFELGIGTSEVLVPRLPKSWWDSTTFACLSEEEKRRFVLKIVCIKIRVHTRLK